MGNRVITKCYIVTIIEKNKNVYYIYSIGVI